MQAVGAPQHWMDSPRPVEPLRLRRVPMLAAALCFAAGDLLALRWEPPGLLTAALIGLLAISVWSTLKAINAAPTAVLGLWVVVGCTCAQIQQPIARQDILTSYADGLSRTVRGRVVRVRELPPEQSSPEAAPPPWKSEPGAWEPEQASTHPATSLDLQVQAVEDVTPEISRMRAVGGGARATVPAAAAPLRCGDTVEVPLRLRIPDTYRDPGAWSYSDYLLSQGIGVLGTARPGQVRVLGHGSGAWGCRLSAAQRWASDRLQDLSRAAPTSALPALLRLQQDDAAMLSAMLVGDRTRLTSDLRQGFERTGTFHLFVVSGLHIVLLTGGILWILRRTRVPEGAAIIATLTIGLLFALLTGFGAPVQRALGMTAAYLFARWIGRDTGPLNALGIAAVAILALDPRALFQASFQMTGLVILGASGVAQPVEARTFGPRLRALRLLDSHSFDANLHPRLAQMRIYLRMYRRLTEDLLHARVRESPVWIVQAVFAVLASVVAGIAIESCMVLPMAAYFHRATLFALPGNLLLIPFVGILLTLAVFTFGASLLSLKLAVFPGALTALLLHTIRATLAQIGKLSHADVRVPAPSVTAILLACAAVAFCCIALRLRSPVWLALAMLAFATAPLAALWPSPPMLHPGMLEVTALDVGQGDSVLVVSPKGNTLLVDAGGPVGPSVALANSRWDIGEQIVAPYLWSRHFRHLDAVLLTHAHSDHMGGMPAVLRDFRPHELWISTEPAEAPGLAALLEQAHQLGIAVRRVHAGDQFQWNGLQAQVLSPDTTYTNPGRPKNDDSLVMRLAYGKGSVLLEGDAEWASEADMVLNHRVEQSTLLKVAHHGSSTSTADLFLAAVAPREALISVGSHNTFGHPRWETLERLERAHVQTWRTDREGAETFLISAGGGISELSAASNP